MDPGEFIKLLALAAEDSDNADSESMSSSALAEHLKRALVLKGNKPGHDNSSDSSDDEDQKKKKYPLEAKMPQTLHLLYAASKLRIYKIADKIAANEVSGSLKLSEQEIQLEIPKQEVWDFKLGDRVRIKQQYSLQDFKSIQSRTLGWNARLRTIYGCQGIVTHRWSEYENGVTIDMPSRFSTSCIYSGLVERIPDSEIDEDTSFTTQWKVNEYVTTIMDKKVVELMQRRLGTIPQRYLGRKGRIIAVTRVAIVVTFNERTSVDINSYLLMRCPDQTPIEISERNHDKFKVGDKVKVLSNIRQLVANQKYHGKWNVSMTSFAGKEVTIIHICKDLKKIRVQYKLGDHWIMNADSLYHEPMKEVPQEDCKFKGGDIVKIRMTNNLRALLDKKDVPMVFLEYLRATAKVKLVDHNFDYLIKYNNDQNVSAYASTIRKATQGERGHHMKVKHDMKNIRVGCEVYLDIGPPNFVKFVLSDSNAHQDVVYALTHPSTLVGYAEDNRAVLEYSNGKRYRIKKRFLTVPDKFNMQGGIDGIELNAAKEILDTIANCVQIVTANEDADVTKGCPVRILHMSFDSAPVVDLRVNSSSASVEQLAETLLSISTWSVDIIADNVIYINGLNSIDREIKVSMYFNQEPYLPYERPDSSQEPMSSKPREPSGTSSVHETPRTFFEIAEKEDCAGPIHNEPQPHGVQAENDHHTGPMDPPQRMSDYRYMPLPHGIYIPYFLDRREPRGHVEEDNNQQQSTNDPVVSKTYIIKHVDRFYTN